ncbi:MAG: hypothetical protein OEZ08_09085 [Betaproteobacteria bacterium]|nr:hypothetical protein [Betaproteobacteria bacterium]
MNLSEFRATLESGSPPRGMEAALRALWHEAKGDWDRAHAMVQTLRGKDAAAVHAYLHRREGDLSNADYWYGRAGVARTRGALDKEWAALVETLLKEE